MKKIRKFKKDTMVDISDYCGTKQVRISLEGGTHTYNFTKSEVLLEIKLQDLIEQKKLSNKEASTLLDLIVDRLEDERLITIEEI